MAMRVHSAYAVLRNYTHAVLQALAAKRRVPTWV